MPPILYVETNFPLSIAKGQDPDAGGILDRDEAGLRIVMPTVCWLEALSFLDYDERLRRRRWGEAANDEAIQAGRNRSAAAAGELTAALDRAGAAFGALLKDTRDGLTRTLLRLARRAELVELTPEVIERALHAPLIEADGADNLILACVLEHAAANPLGPKAFLSGNARDFNQPEVLKRLKGAGVDAYLTRAAQALGWADANADAPDPGGQAP